MTRAMCRVCCKLVSNFGEREDKREGCKCGWWAEVVDWLAGHHQRLWREGTVVAATATVWGEI